MKCEVEYGIGSIPCGKPGRFRLIYKELVQNRLVSFVVCKPCKSATIKWNKDNKLFKLMSANCAYKKD